MPKPLLFLLILCLALAGCSSQQPGQETISPVASAPTQSLPPAPAEGPVTVYYPEGAGETDAAYRVTYTLPSFIAMSALRYAAMNDALGNWLDELFQRVEAERLPLADRAEGEELPATEVTYEIREADTPLGSYTNVLLLEKNWFDNANAPAQRLSALVFDEDGLECSLASISGVYAPEALAAQQVWNIISRNPGAYYGDLEMEDIAAALDLYNGFTVADEGYTLYVQPGVLAAEESNPAPLEFSFGRNAMYPDFVGEEITAEDYEALLPQFFRAATYCGPLFQSWRAGDPLPEEALSYGLRLDEARPDGEGLVLSGLLMKGLPGDADALEAARAQVRLTPAGAGAGWELAAVDIS